MKITLVIVLFAAASAAYGVSSRQAATVGDATCRPPLHECPKCNGDGYYCGEYCMDCPLIAAPDENELAAVTCGGKVCGADTYCCNPGCGQPAHCLPDGAACPAHTCD